MKIGKALGLYCLFMAVLPYSVNSQIVLGTEDQPEAGRTFFIHNVENIPGNLDLQFGESNFNVVLSELETQSVDTARFVKPETRPEGSAFPESDLAVVITGKDVNTTNYLRREKGQTLITGVYDDLFKDGTFTAFQLKPEGLYFRTPFTVDDSLNDLHGLEHKFENPISFPGVDTLILKSTVTTEAFVDGHGTIQLPDLKAMEVLRVKFTRRQDITTNAYVGILKQWNENTNEVAQYGYSYFTKGLGHSLVDVITSESGEIQLISYVGNPNSSSVRSRQTSISRMNVYPNPVQSSLHFDGALSGNNATVNVYDPAGKKVLSATLNEEKSIDVSQLNPGLYTIRAISRDGIRMASFVKE